MLLLNIIKNMFTCKFSSSFCFSVYLKLKAITYDKTPEIISVLTKHSGYNLTLWTLCIDCSFSKRLPYSSQSTDLSFHTNTVK